MTRSPVSTERTSATAASEMATNASSAYNSETPAWRCAAPYLASMLAFMTSR